MEEPMRMDCTHLQAKRVEASSIRGMKSLALDVVAPPAIVVCVGTKVQRAGGDVVAALCVCEVVPAGFHDVNLARARPLSVDVVSRQHPDRRPKPVASRELGSHLDATKLDGRTQLGVDATRPHGVDECAIGCVGGCKAVCPLGTGTALVADVVGLVVVEL
jgi:hypothetical protein